VKRDHAERRLATAFGQGQKYPYVYLVEHIYNAINLGQFLFLVNKLGSFSYRVEVVAYL
jgi:hypothetical protein